MGIVDKVGPNVTGLREGDRVVTAFCISCGDCKFCKQKLTTFCDRTNPSSFVPLPKALCFFCMLNNDVGFRRRCTERSTLGSLDTLISLVASRVDNPNSFGCLSQTRTSSRSQRRSQTRKPSSFLTSSQRATTTLWTLVF